MKNIVAIAVVVLAALGRSAVAADTFTLRENVHVAQKQVWVMSFDHKVKSTSTTNGVPTVTDTDTGCSWKLTLTVIAVRDGSALRMLARVDPDSVDLARNAKGDMEQKPCPYAGQPVLLMIQHDNSLNNDFQGNASDDDSDLLNGFIAPDEEWYPDKPVAVGDTWDCGAKVAKYASLGPKDQLKCKGRLDWVKTIDDKQMAQVTNTLTSVYHEDGNVEEDVEYTMTQLVDLASGSIVKADQTGSSKYITPATEPTQKTGGSQFMWRGELVPEAAKSSTRPAEPDRVETSDK
jgi:hypothetical protein